MSKSKRDERLSLKGRPDCGGEGSRVARLACQIDRERQKTGLDFPNSPKFPTRSFRGLEFQLRRRRYSKVIQFVGFLHVAQPQQN